MLFWQYTSDPGLSRYLFWKLLSAGFFIIGIGLLILLFPELLAIPVAALCFLGGGALLVGAWKIFWAGRRAEKSREYEDATFIEIQ